MRKSPPSRLAGRSRAFSSRVVRDVTRKPRDWNEATAARSLSASRTPVSSRPSPSQALYAYLGIVVLPYGLHSLLSLHSLPSRLHLLQGQVVDWVDREDRVDLLIVYAPQRRNKARTESSTVIPASEPVSTMRSTTTTRGDSSKPCTSARICGYLPLTRSCSGRDATEPGVPLCAPAAGGDSKKEICSTPTPLDAIARSMRERRPGRSGSRGIRVSNASASSLAAAYCLLISSRCCTSTTARVSSACFRRASPRAAATSRTWGKNTTSVSTIAMAKPIPTCRKNRAPGRRLGLTAPFPSGAP